MSKIAAFLAQALAHYAVKLADETKQFGVLGISDAFIENNSRKVVDEEDAGQIWSELSKQSGLHLHVDYCPGNPQCVFGVLSGHEIPRPGQFYELWYMVQMLKDEEEDDGEKIESLELYEGPYKLDVPESIFDSPEG